jgi:hypothetical protein
MWTQTYKGYFIHGYCDRAECRIQDPDTLETIKTCKSLHAAKIAITKHIKIHLKGGITIDPKA